MTTADYDAFEKLFCGVKWQSYKDENMLALLDHSGSTEATKAMTLEMTTYTVMSRKENSIEIHTEMQGKTGETHKIDMTIKFNEEFIWKDNEANPTMAASFLFSFKDNKVTEIMTPKPPLLGKPNRNVYTIENNELVMVGNVVGDTSVIGKIYYKKA